MKTQTTLTVIALTTLLAGCAAPEFKISRADDRFTTNKNTVLVSENNRISSRSIPGGQHVDAKGVYVDPYVEKDLASGKVVDMGLYVSNRTTSSTLVGNMFRLGTLQQIVFRLDDGSLITLPIGQREIATPGVMSYNRMSGIAEVEIVESGTAKLSTPDFLRLAQTQAVSIKIQGTIQSAVYEEKDISPSFLTNIRQFKEASGL